MAWVEKVGRRFRVGWMDPETGRQRYRGGFESKADARSFASRIETGDVPSDLTLETYAERIFDSSMELRGSTLYAYRKTFARHVGSRPIARRRLTDLTTQDMREFFAGLDVGPSARASVYRVLAKVLNAAEREGVVSKSPLRPVKKPRDERRREVVPQPIELVEALAAAVDPYFRLAVLLAGYGGLRGGEVGGLRLRDADCDRSQLQIVQATARHGGQRVLSDVKTAASRRRIDVPAFLLEEVVAHAREFGVADDGRLYQTATGGLVVSTTFDGAVKAGAERLGLPPVRFHDLRHTCAALMIAEGAHPKTIQTHMGHSSITVSLDVYGHLFSGLGRQVADNLGEARRKVQEGRSGLDVA